jgi:hypothetical protein
MRGCLVRCWFGDGGFWIAAGEFLSVSAGCWAGGRVGVWGRMAGPANGESVA